MNVRQLASTCLLCTLMQACSTPSNNASAKCMEQADLAYIDKSNHDDLGISPDCFDNKTAGKPSNVPSNSILESAILEAVVSILDSSTN